MKFDFDKFSSFDKVKNVVAYTRIFRFCNKVKGNKVFKGHLRTIELQNALTRVIKVTQFESFGNF